MQRPRSFWEFWSFIANAGNVLWAFLFAVLVLCVVVAFVLLALGVPFPFDGRGD